MKSAAMPGDTAKSQHSSWAEFRTSGRLLLAATVGTTLGLPGLLFYSLGIFAPALAREFHWSFGTIFSGIAFIPISILLGGPVIGYLVDRFGDRNIAALSLCGLGGAYASLAFSTGSVTQYYASCLAIAVLGSGATFVPFTRAVNSAFVQRRGFALGVTVAGSGIFAFLVKPLAGALLPGFGWRGTLLAIGLLPIIIGAPAVLWGLPRRDPATAGPAVAGAGPTAQPAGVTVRQALRSRVFWMMLLVFAPISLANAGPLPHIENILKSVHIADRTALSLASLVGVMMIAGRLIGGWLMDRIWAPLVGAVIIWGGVLGWWLLSQPTATYQQAMAAILLVGFAAGVEGNLMSYLAARYLGVRSYGVVYGLLFGVFAVGGSFGPGLIGSLYDHIGNYQLIMGGCAGLLAFSSVVLLCLGPFPTEVKATSLSTKRSSDPSIEVLS